MSRSRRRQHREDLHVSDALLLVMRGIGMLRFALPHSNEHERQESESHGASVLQEAPNLRQLLPTLDGTQHYTLPEMQPSTLEVPEGERAPELRTGCQSGRLRAVPQASPNCHQQTVPEVSGLPRQPEEIEQMKDRQLWMR